MKYLFFGDSVTDCERDRDDVSSLGEGYVAILARHLAHKMPDAVVVNTGVAADKSEHLLARYERDCRDYRPDVLTILVGINDCWSRPDYTPAQCTQRYEAHMREILRRVRADLGDIPVVLMEPFALPLDTGWVTIAAKLTPKLQALHRVAEDFGCQVIPLGEIFTRAMLSGLTPAELAADAIHPTATGHELIAAAWLAQQGV